MCMCVYVNVCYLCADNLECQKIVSTPQLLKLQVIGSYLTWVLGTEFRSSARAADTPNYEAISPVPILYL